MENKKERIVISNVDGDFKRKFKSYCADKDVDMQDFALEAIKEKIKRENKICWIGRELMNG